MTTAAIPAGYRQNTSGHLVPEEMIKDLDKMRDDLVGELVKKAMATSNVLKEFKKRVFDEIDSFVELSSEQYGKKWGGKKGNISLVSFDGQFKVVMAIAEYFSFDERLQVAKELIDECINDWAKGSRPEIRTLINDAFKVNQKGLVDTKRIMSLRRLDIKDERWLQAMTAINDSLEVAFSRSYVRVYERIGNTNRWQQVPLDLASV
ncbi:MAG: DUF3164 family protein [Desulfobulbaceae bacterium]|nr:DUF3164 family protein [Desulfobulbaceae bacterium]